MKLIARSILIVLLVSSVGLSQTRRTSRSRGRARAQASDPRILSRETATRLLLPVVERKSKQEPEWDGFDLRPTTVSPDQFRRIFRGYGIADRCAWITMRIEGDRTIVELTEAGRRIFEGPSPTAGTRKNGTNYQFDIYEPRAIFRQITGIRFLSSDEAIVEYTWGFDPTPLVAPCVGPSAEDAAARLGRYDDGWRITMLGTVK